MMHPAVAKGNAVFKVKAFDVRLCFLFLAGGAEMSATLRKYNAQDRCATLPTG